MNRVTSSKSGFSRRDLRLIVTFGLFAEAVLAYMLLVDQPLTQIAKMQGLAETVRTAHETVLAAVNAGGRPAKEAAAAVPYLEPEAGESPTMAIQQALDLEASEAGARLKAVTVEPAALDEAGLLRYTATMTLEGSYEAIATFMERLETPRHVVKVETLAVSGASEAADVLQTTLTLGVYLPKP